MQNIFLIIEHGFVVLNGNLEGCNPVVLRKFHADYHEILRDTSADLHDLLFAVIF